MEQSSVWLSILPSLTAIVLAMVTRQVIPSLLVGLWLGSFFESPGILSSITNTLDRIVTTISDRGNLDVLLFLYIFSGFIATVQVSGGVNAFARWVERAVKGKRSALLVSWLLLPLTFIDCGFRVVATGSIMKPIARDFRISPERLAYMLNNSASPIVALVPVATTFVGYMIAVLTSGLSAANLSGEPFTLFLRTIPFNFFSYTSAMIAVGSIFSYCQFRAMRQVEENYRPQHDQQSKAVEASLSQDKPPDEKKHVQRQIDETSMTHAFEVGEELSETDRARMDTAKDQMGTAVRNHTHDMDMGMHMDQPEEPAIKPRVLNLLLPIALLIFLSFLLIVLDGLEPGRDLVQIFAEANASRMMLAAVFLSFIVSAALYLVQGVPLKLLIDRFIQGGNKLMVTIVILAVAWPIATVSRDLGLAQLVEGTLGGSIPAVLVPLAAFLVTSVVTYFIGSSWGSWALMMPLAISLAATSGASVPLTAAAVFSGGTFGDVTSPLSGMTAMSAGIAGAEHMKYVRAMTPYNLLAATIAAVLFYIVPVAL